MRYRSLIYRPHELIEPPGLIRATCLDPNRPSQEEVYRKGFSATEDVTLFLDYCHVSVCYKISVTIVLSNYRYNCYRCIYDVKSIYCVNRCF